MFKHLPLPIHPKAPAAHVAAEAAHRQGKFFEMYDKIFSNQAEMSPAKYEEYAAEIGLDLEQFKQDVASDAVKQRISTDAREVQALGINSTPAFLVNGKYLSGAQPFERFKAVIDQEIAEKGT